MTSAVAPFDLFSRGSGEALVLAGARMSGLMLIAPALSETVVPRSYRVMLVVILTLLLQPMAQAAMSTVPNITGATLMSETVIGFSIGLGAALLIAAAEAAGDVVAVQIGLSGSAILDPLSNENLPVLGTFMRLFALTLLLSFNLHLQMLSALADSFHALPLGQPVSLAGGLMAMLQLGGALFVFGVRFAAPVIATVLITNVALAVLGRAAPQLNILSVSFPIQIAVGLLTLIASLPAIARFFGGWSGVYDGMLSVVARGFTAVAIR